MMLELLIYGGCLCACLQSFLPHNTHHRHTQNNTQTQSGEGEYNFTLNRFNILNVAESVRFATFARRQTTLLPKTQHTHTHAHKRSKQTRQKKSNVSEYTTNNVRANMCIHSHVWVEGANTRMVLAHLHAICSTAPVVIFV